MSMQHKALAAGKWNELSLMEQLANIGSEVERSMKWRSKKKEYSQMAFERALELTDLTIADSKNRKRLKEIVRMREILCDYFVFDNTYRSSDDLWRKYFYAFNYGARNI